MLDREPLVSLSGALLLVAACNACTTDPGPPPPPPPPAPPTLALRDVGTGYSFPVFVTAAPGDPSRLFVVEKGGLIKIIKNGAPVATPFLDVSAKVSRDTEQGLLGLAFHPGYATNGIFVVDYTNTQGNTRIATYKVSANADVADPASEQIVLGVIQPFANHNGGILAFGRDGQLYIGMGDGGSGGDPQGNGQKRTTLLGKILRLTISATGQASIPADNPLIGQAGLQGEIWSWGLRNPWRFSFDRGTGDLYIGDVGQNEREEIDVATSAGGGGKGANFGWNIMEASACYNASTCDMSGLVLPVVEYTHTGGACSVTGGYVYRGSALPASFRGTYFYADYCAGWVRSFRYQAGQSAEPLDWASLTPGPFVTSFGEDADGEIYVMTSAGRIAKIVPGS